MPDSVWRGEQSPASPPTAVSGLPGGGRRQHTRHPPLTLRGRPWRRRRLALSGSGGAQSGGVPQDGEHRPGLRAQPAGAEQQLGCQKAGGGGIEARLGGEHAGRLQRGVHRCGMVGSQRDHRQQAAPQLARPGSVSAFTPTSLCVCVAHYFEPFTSVRTFLHAQKHQDQNNYCPSMYLLGICVQLYPFS